MTRQSNSFVFYVDKIQYHSLYFILNRVVLSRCHHRCLYVRSHKVFALASLFLILSCCNPLLVAYQFKMSAVRFLVSTDSLGNLYPGGKGYTGDLQNEVFRLFGADMQLEKIRSHS